MKEPEHTAKDEPTTTPAHDEVAKKAYSIYLNEGRPQGHAEQNWLEARRLVEHPVRAVWGDESVKTRHSSAPASVVERRFERDFRLVPSPALN